MPNADFNNSRVFYWDGTNVREVDRLHRLRNGENPELHRLVVDFLNRNLPSYVLTDAAAALYSPEHPRDLVDVRCGGCGEWTAPESSFHYDGDAYCPACRASMFTACSDCGAVRKNSSLTTIQGTDKKVCRSCLAHYRQCTGCGDFFRVSDIAMSARNVNVCDDCACDYSTCDECGRIFNSQCIHPVFLNSDWRNLCEGCEENLTPKMLNDYSYKPEPVFYKHPDDAKGIESFYGVELESDDGDRSREMLKELFDAYNGHAYSKKDGSLDCGVEVVTHPCTLRYHRKSFPWADISKVLLKYDFRSHDTSTCGLHVHASRDAFGRTSNQIDLNIAKVILIVDRFWESNIVPLSRRDISRLDRWAGKPNANINSYDDDDDAITKAKRTASRGRYQAINLENEHTVEFRFFRGTLRRDTIIASIELVDALIAYAKKTPLKVVMTCDWADIFKNTKYAELTAYQAKKLGGR